MLDEDYPQERTASVIFNPEKIALAKRLYVSS
jgi:hypothetical protein